jgi:hypothetical protein
MSGRLDQEADGILLNQNLNMRRSALLAIGILTRVNDAGRLAA